MSMHFICCNFAATSIFMVRYHRNFTTISLPCFNASFITIQDLLHGCRKLYLVGMFLPHLNKFMFFFSWGGGGAGRGKGCN